MTPIRQLPLRFAEHAVTTETHVNLSAVRTDGRWLWIAGDETATVDLPFGDGDDHAEGIALLDGAELLVVYDSPAPSRLAVPGTVLADVVRLR